MGTICYIVTATLPNEAIADEFVAWLENGHVNEVIEGGAERAKIVRLDREKETPGWRVMVEYIFADRAEFGRYVENVAPKLRADGLAKFGPDRGVKFERRVGEIGMTHFGWEIPF